MIKIIFAEDNVSYEYLEKATSQNKLKDLAKNFYKTDMAVAIELKNNGIENSSYTVTQENGSSSNYHLVEETRDIFDGKIIKNKGRS